MIISSSRTALLKKVVGLLFLLLSLCGCVRSVSRESALTAVPTRQSFQSFPTPSLLPIAVEQAVVEAVLDAPESGDVQAKYITPGSFSQSGVNEWLALVAGIPDYEGPQWVIVGFSGGRWQVLSLLNSIAQEADDSINFEDFASDWDEPQLIDFNHDGLNEAIVVQSSAHNGWEWKEARLFHWLDSGWREQDWSVITYQDNTMVGPDIYPQPYRYTYQVNLTWLDMDEDGIDELVLGEDVTYFSLEHADAQVELGKIYGTRSGELIYEWNGKIFEPLEGQDQLLSSPTSVLYPWWNLSELPPVTFAEYLDGQPQKVYFLAKDGFESVQETPDWSDDYEFSVQGDKLFYPGYYLDIEGSYKITKPNLPGNVSMIPDSNFQNIAWLFTRSVADQSSIEQATESAALLVSSGNGGQPRVVWQSEENTGNVNRYVLLGWSADDRLIYLSQPPADDDPIWKTNPRILAVDPETGLERLLSNSVNIVDAAISEDDNWLAQVERTAEGDQYILVIRLRSLLTGDEMAVPIGENVVQVGDLSFSKQNKWFVWQEKYKSKGQIGVRIKGFKISDQTLSEIYAAEVERESDVGRIGGWINTDQFVYVMNGGKGDSYLVSLPDGGLGIPLSFYSFLGVRN